MAFEDGTELVDSNGLVTIDTDGEDIDAALIAIPDTEVVLQVNDGPVLLFIETGATDIQMTIKAPTD